MPDMKPVSGRKPGKRATAPAVPPIDPQAFLQATEGIRSDRKLKAGDVVFGQGDPADAVFYIRSGRIQLTVVSDQGKEGVIALFGPGDFFGEGCLAGQPRAHGVGRRHRAVGRRPDREGGDGPAAP